MTARAGTPARPLRVAIIGSGPSGFYAAEHLQKRDDIVVQTDVYDRLPTPFGLVRGGVAPDHQKIKSVTRVFDRLALHPAFRFYGNVEIGRDLTRDDLHDFYDAVIYAVGAQTDRRLGIPGEDLAGSHAATDFVGWYNAHPDFCERSFELDAERVVVVGNGNVAMDVVRILAKHPDELAETDIADYALEALRASAVREIHVIGRRGPAQASFTAPEIKALGELEHAEVVVDPAELELDEATAASLDGRAERNLEVLREIADRPPRGAARRILLRFLASPAALVGSERVEAVRLTRNELRRSADGSVRAVATEQEELLPAELVFRSIGYSGVPVPGLPFDDYRGVIPNERGRIVDPDSGAQVAGEYVAGWIKRGPSGIIGTNKPDAQETVDALLEDAAAGVLLQPGAPDREALEEFLLERRPDYVSYEDWQLIDAMEQERGQAHQRVRLKFSRVEDMLDALALRREEQGARR